MLNITSRHWTRDPRPLVELLQRPSKITILAVTLCLHLWRDIRFSNRHVPIALGTFSNMEHYFTFPALLSTFLTFEQNLSIFSLFGQHFLSTFLQFSTCLMQYFVVETFSGSRSLLWIWINPPCPPVIMKMQISY